MSGVVKSVGKVFRKAVKVAKKVAPIVLGAAAVYFTAGAALGLTPTLGAAASSLVGGSVLGSSTLASVVTGAVTQAGYGAAIGGLAAAATGKSISKGMGTGALTGAVTGGVTGGLGWNTDPLSSLNSTETGAAFNASTGLPTAGRVSDAVASNAAGLATPGVGSTAGALGTAATNAVAQAAPASTGLLSWLNNNQTLAGTAIAGLGTGLMANDDAEAKRATTRDERTAITNNYALPSSAPSQGGMPGGASSSNPGGLLTPSQRFNPNFYAQQAGATPTVSQSASGVGSYAINPQTGRWEYTPAGRIG